MNIYVGNLSHQTTENELSELFKPYGNVASAKIITDHFSGTSRGFGFVEMESNDATEAIKQLNGTDFGGRPLVVNEARPRTEGGSGGGGREGGSNYRGSNGSSGYSSGRSSSGGGQGGGNRRW